MHNKLNVYSINVQLTLIRTQSPTNGKKRNLNFGLRLGLEGIY